MSMYDLVRALQRIMRDLERGRNLYTQKKGWGFVNRLHPRKDWQQRPYWLRIRSNPFRANYH